MTVWIVIYVGKYETFPAGVYSSQEAAYKHADRDGDDGPFVVEEWVVDEGRV